MPLMKRITVHAYWDGFESDRLEVVEERARDILKLYGFSLVRVRAIRGKEGILLALTGVDKDARKAKALFES
jgi:hypothetical protein